MLDVNDLKPQLCSSLFTGVPCDRENCPYLHLPDYQVSISTVCEIDDLFYLSELSKGDDSLQVNFTERDRQILTGERPVLCWVCMHPVSTFNDSYCTCCDIWICRKCEGKWPFAKHCPKCGRKGTVGKAPSEKSESVEKANRALNAAEILDDVG